MFAQLDTVGIRVYLSGTALLKRFIFAVGGGLEWCSIGRGSEPACSRHSPSFSLSAAAAEAMTAAVRAGNVELSFLVDNSDQAVKPAEALIAAFEKKNPTSRSSSRRDRRAATATTS